MTTPFDKIYDRRSSDSIKWNFFDTDVLPMWVADMDFSAPEPVSKALIERASHPIYGYFGKMPGLIEAIQSHLVRLYQWEVAAEDIIMLPGVIVGFNLAAQALAKPGGSLVIQTPVYMPFLDVARNAGLRDSSVDLLEDEQGCYSVDWQKFEAAIADNASLFLLCNPHNPVGRVYTAEELTRMADICLKYEVPIVSDEIHSDLIFSGHHHTPIALLSPEINQRTITLMAPSKTFNVPGLGCAFAIIQNPELRKLFNNTRRGLVGGANGFGMVAAQAAYTEGQTWLTQLLHYLEGNRDALVAYVHDNLPLARITVPEGTYLAWVDLRAYNLEPSPCEYLIKHAKVGLNDGAAFGKSGTGFVRINFACPRNILMEGLEKIRIALEKVPAMK